MLLLASTSLMLAGCGATPVTATDGGSETKSAAVPAAAAGDAAPAPVADDADDTASTNLATTPEAALAAMRGQWVSIEDPRATLSISGNQVTMGYAGDSTATTSFRLDFVSECEGRAISGPRLGFTLTGDDMVLCYTDLEVDARNLEYFYMPRGNRQAFRRPG